MKEPITDVLDYMIWRLSWLQLLDEDRRTIRQEAEIKKLKKLIYDTKRSISRSD